jgi:hypothetical protein
MYILIDHRIPDKAKRELAKYGQLLELGKNNITYEAISSHPDIFCCQTPDKIILAPNTPIAILDKFEDLKIDYIFGKNAVGLLYPHTSHYNAVVTHKFVIHNTKNTDESIIENSYGKEIISVKQAYTRCNLIALQKNYFITSDKGIFKQLQSNHDFTVIYSNPDQIILPGMKHGFLGGCCGIYQNYLFVTGKLKFLAEEKAIRFFLDALDMQIIELYDGPLFDGGSIIFIAQ